MTALSTTMYLVSEAEPGTEQLFLNVHCMNLLSRQKEKWRKPPLEWLLIQRFSNSYLPIPLLFVLIPV